MPEAEDRVARDLLDLCAVLPWFDSEALGALGPYGGAELALLVAEGLAVPVEGRPDGFRLAEEARVAQLRRLRAERPEGEVALLRRAYPHAVGRLGGGATARADEGACAELLDRLFTLLLPQLAWQELGEAVGQLRAVGPREARTLRRVAVYEGYLDARTGEYARGEATLLACLDDGELGGELRCHALNGLATIAFNQTRYDRALEWYRRLHEQASAVGNAVYQGVALLNQGGVYRTLERHEEALEFALRSLEIYQGLGERVREAFATYLAGISALSLGRWGVAAQQLGAAEDRLTALGNQSFLIAVLWGQGQLYFFVGDEARSEAAYRRALSLASAPTDGERIAAMDCHLFLGLLYETQGRWGAALEEYAEAEALARLVGHQHRLVPIHYRQGMACARRGRPEEALAAYRRGIEAAEALRVDTRQEAVKIDLLGTAQQLYEAMVLLCVELGRPDEAFEYVERARSRAFLDAFAGRWPGPAGPGGEGVATLAEVRAALPPRALLLEYFTTGVVPRGEHQLNQLPPRREALRDHLGQPPRTLLFAVARDHFGLHELALDPNALRPVPGDPSPGRRFVRGRLPTRLYEALIAPVAALVRGCRQLQLIPHGPLHYVPFMALQAPGGAPLLAADGPALALAPSATVWLRAGMGRQARAGEVFLALGYNGEDRDGEGARGRRGEGASGRWRYGARGLGRLRHAEAEAEGLARLLGGEAWTGAGPKRRRLLERAPRVRWLHFAGHGVHEPLRPLESHLQLSAGEVLTAGAILAECELGAELVTMSACTSGVSQVGGGDELLGLPRAFLAAGVPTVVCTHWEADDLVARIVMGRFYAGLRDGKTPAAALRDAQVAVRAMTGREVAALVASWRAAGDGEWAEGEMPELAAGDPEGAVFDDPLCWAPFMVIGRA